MEIINYSEKAIAVVGGDTKQMKDHLKAMGGRFNPRLSCGAGWIFPAMSYDDESEVQNLFTLMEELQEHYCE